MIEGFAIGLNWLNDTQMAEAIRDSAWLFPIFETAHVIAIVFVVGSILRLDLRLLGLIQRHRPVTEISEDMLPYTWTGFLFAAIFGFLLWASKPITYLEMAFFDVKLILLLLAGLNMLYFQFATWKTVGQWDHASVPPTSARFAGGLSMAFWISIVVCGRFMGFV